MTVAPGMTIDLGVITSKTNELLRGVLRLDGATPFAIIDKASENRGWNGEREIEICVGKVNKAEEMTRITEVLKAQLNAVCGGNIMRVYRQPVYPDSIIVQGVPEDLEGAELLKVIQEQNPGLVVTPRWLRKFPNSRIARVEVESPVEAEKAIKGKRLTIRGETREVSGFDSRRALTGGHKAAPILDAPKGPKAGTPARRSFVDIVANAGYTRRDGWTTVGGSKNVGGTCRMCAKTGHLERACPQRLKVRQFACHGCGQLGHFISACMNKLAKGTSLFARKGCYNCGKHDHQDDQCRRPDKRKGEEMANIRWTPAPLTSSIRQAETSGSTVNNLRGKEKGKEISMPTGFVNNITTGPYRKKRLDDTVAKMSKVNGTSAPPPPPPPSAGPAGARTP